jgi:hypothetical protein
VTVSPRAELPARITKTIVNRNVTAVALARGLAPTVEATCLAIIVTSFLVVL